jgi:hypothetical protein
MAENDRSDLKASNDRGHRIRMNGCDDASTVAASTRAAGRLAAERGAAQLYNLRRMQLPRRQHSYVRAIAKR